MVGIIFLGTGNAFGHTGRRRSSYIIIGKDQKILLDAGFDTLPGLYSKNMTVSDIDAIFISHLHPDHYFGIPQIALENLYAIKRKVKIPIYCPPETKNTIRNITKLVYNEDVFEHLDDLFDFHEFDVGETVEFASGSIEAIYANHTANPRMQFIKIDDKKIGYTGDTAFVEESFERLLEADVVITEASSATHKIPYHTTLEDLLNYDIPDDKVVYLSHLGQTVIDRRDEIEPPLFLAEDGMEIEIV